MLYATIEESKASTSTVDSKILKKYMRFSVFLSVTGLHFRAYILLLDRYGLRSIQVPIWALIALIVTTSNKALELPFPLLCLNSCRYVQNETRAGLLNLCSGLIASDISPSPDQSAVAEHELFSVIQICLRAVMNYACCP